MISKKFFPITTTSTARKKGAPTLYTFNILFFPSVMKLVSHSHGLWQHHPFHIITFLLLMISEKQNGSYNLKIYCSYKLKKKKFEIFFFTIWWSLVRIHPHSLCVWPVPVSSCSVPGHVSAESTFYRSQQAKRSHLCWLAACLTIFTFQKKKETELKVNWLLKLADFFFFCTEQMKCMSWEQQCSFLSSLNAPPGAPSSVPR